VDIAEMIELGALVKWSAVGAENDDSRPEAVSAPVSPTDLAVTALTYGGVPYAMSRLPLLSRMFGPPASLGKSLVSSLGPGAFPLIGASDVAQSLLGPSSMSSRIDEMREAGRTAAKRYGALALPIQALHGVLNPVTSIGYGLSSLGRAVLGKSGSLADEARAAISDVLAG